MKEALKFIDQLGIENKNIVVATSGGPDSMFLLDLFNTIKDKYNFNIICAHVHHNLRKESDEEALNLKKYCKLNNIIFEMYKINEYPNNKFSEEAARKIRYSFFDNLIKKYKTDILFTAHHADDLMETILMRIVRGSNLKGYAGIKEVSTDRGYIIARPLLSMTKQEIIDYLDKKGLWYAIDLSNSSDLYTRNRYRNHLISELKKENKNVHLKFKEYSNNLLLASDYIENQVLKAYEEVVMNEKIIINIFKKLDKIIQIKLIEKYLYNIYNEDIINVNSKHINLIIEQIMTKDNSIIDMPLNKKGIIEYNYFKIIDDSIRTNYDFILGEKVKLPNGYVVEIDNNTKLTSNYVIHLNLKEIELPIHIRNRKNGDKMTIKNMSGTKKVSDILTNSKVSKELRANYPVVVDNNGTIIWIPGIKKSQFDRKKEQKYDIILKYSYKEETYEQ